VRPSNGALLEDTRRFNPWANSDAELAPCTRKESTSIIEKMNRKYKVGRCSTLGSNGTSTDEFVCCSTSRFFVVCGAHQRSLNQCGHKEKNSGGITSLQVLTKKKDTEKASVVSNNNIV
jgi:hypothetical protein